MLEVIKIRITPENIGRFYINDSRLGTPEFTEDRIELEKKIVAFVKGEKTELTKKYPQRYDLTVFTYNQFAEPYLINDGCHRIMALRELFYRNEIDGFDVFILPSNILGAKTKEEALALNKEVDAALKRAGLPLWVKKFDYELRGSRLIAWKNINLIDTGGQDKRLQYGVNWFLNDDIRLKLVDVDEHNHKNKYKL